MQQRVQRMHDFGFAADLERSIGFDIADPVRLDVARDDGGKGATQIGGEQVQYDLIEQRRDVRTKR